MFAFSALPTHLYPAVRFVFESSNFDAPDRVQVQGVRLGQCCVGSVSATSPLTKRVVPGMTVPGQIQKSSFWACWEHWGVTLVLAVQPFVWPDSNFGISFDCLTYPY